MARRPSFLRRRSSATPDRPHRFEEIDDPGLAAAAIGLAGSRPLGGIAQIVVTDNFIRKSGCGFPGCGRPREDPIHQVEE